MVLYFDFVTWIKLMSGAKRPGVSFSQEEQLDSIPWYKHQSTWWDSSSSLPEDLRGQSGAEQLPWGEESGSWKMPKQQTLPYCWRRRKWPYHWEKVTKTSCWSHPKCLSAAGNCLTLEEGTSSGGACLSSQHSAFRPGGRGRRSSELRPECVPGQRRLHRQTLS